VRNEARSEIERSKLASGRRSPLTAARRSAVRPVESSPVRRCRLSLRRALSRRSWKDWERSPIVVKDMGSDLQEPGDEVVDGG
jgi:hypothetical protein